MKKITKIVSLFLLAVTLVLAASDVLPIAENVKIVEASTIKINKTKLNLQVGKKATLKIIGTKKKVKWTSSKKSVATVSSKGQVTAKKMGTATITAKVGKKTYTCKITVKYKNDLVVKVGNSKIYMDEMMYYIYVYESIGELYNAVSDSDTNLWNSEYEDGVTMREYMKNMLIDDIIMNEIFYEKALKAGYTITKDEIAENKESVTFTLEFMTEEQLKITGFTEKKLLKVLEKSTISEKYQTDLIDSFNIDDAAITATINKEDYHQYNTTYMFFPATSINDSGKSVVNKESALKHAKAALKASKAGIAFENIIADYDDATTDTLNFVKGDGSAEEAYEAAALNLKNDEYSEIVETDAGYYIIKMLNNNSLESYNEAVDVAITDEEDKQLDEYYEKIKKDYKITINDKVWDRIVLGKVTINQ